MTDAPCLFPLVFIAAVAVCLPLALYFLSVRLFEAEIASVDQFLTRGQSGAVRMPTLLTGAVLRGTDVRGGRTEFHGGER
jgi:hypothetical protein